MNDTPKHASWLNMAELEFSALAKQCLDRRISDYDFLEADYDFLEAELNAWCVARNRKQVKLNW